MIETKRFFGLSFNNKKIINKFNKLKILLKKINYPIRVHFRIYKNGKFQIFLSKLIKKKHLKVKISNTPISSYDIFRYYKTSNRNLYNYELELAKKQGFDEVIFFNENYFVTEGSFTNIIIKINGKFFTPKQNAGLLNGIFRKKLLQKKIIEEKDFDLKVISKNIYLINSVRGISIGYLDIASAVKKENLDTM